jgi:negative regulator of flagellin synthesis FlgM
MEISRHLKPAPTTPSDAAPARHEQPRTLLQPAARPAAALPLEQMQDALRAMPEVDLDRVAAIRLALQSGELSTDPGELAASIYAYHRGSDA